MSCKGKCLTISEAVGYHNRKRYKIGTTGLKCSVCEIHLPINHHLIKVYKAGNRHCPCCGQRLSGRINDKKEYIDSLVLNGTVKRY